MINRNQDFQKLETILKEIKKNEKIKNNKSLESLDRTMSLKQRKETGSFYTDNLICKIVIENSFYYLKNLQQEKLEKREISILEPSCGDGKFVIQLIQYLIEKHQFSLIEALSSIHAVDINANAIEKTKENIYLFIEKCQLSNNNQSYSDLKNNQNEKEEIKAIINKNIIEKDFFDFVKKQQESKTGYDLIIGNPPFGNIPHLTKNYKNIALSFQEESFKLLNNKGLLSFIMPHSFSRTHGEARKWRDNIKDSLIDVIDIGSPFFDVTLEMCVYSFLKDLKYEKLNLDLDLETKENNYANKIVSKSIKSILKKDKRTKTIILDEEKLKNNEIFEKQIERKYFYSPFHQMVLYVDETYIEIQKNIEKKLKNKEKEKKDIFILNGKRGRDYPSYMLKNVKESEDDLFIINGKNVQKGEIVHIQNYDKFINKNLYGSEIKKIENEEIVIGQFGKKLKATLVPKESILSGGVIVIEANNNHLTKDELIKYLNNEKVERYLQQYILNEADLTVHLDGQYLKQIPIFELI